MTRSPIVAQAEKAKLASRVVANASTNVKDDALGLAAELLEERVGELVAANQVDLARAEEGGASDTALDRLRLTDGRVRSMIEGLLTVSGLTDPVGSVVDGVVRPNGLRIERVRVPLGVVGVIYENRPNVTSDAAALCLKAGNSALLRGSAAAFDSNKVIARTLRSALSKVGLPEDCVVLAEDTTHEGAVDFMRLDGLVDCLIPRGGPALIASVRENATVPTIIDGDGNCHLYVDRSADLDMALEILVDAKTSRPGVCNATETLLVHRHVAERFLPKARQALPTVELVGDAATRSLVPGVALASESDFRTEFLDLKLAVAVVDDLAGAIEHIRRYSSGHTEAIVTTDLPTAETFTREVDAAAVVVNASTRLVDGGEFGFGAEIGISTQKLHVRGPMGLEALTCVKYVVRGDGQVRS
ncbi:MAG TPA: glutamate-5-semialdehyde dehydrogenase [Acidimicrobiales bacterium]|nr:glutamate-5-semialdehyde dehydrogenase [Acidimicrobiales bacterium]